MEGETIQWPIEKEQKDKQWSTTHRKLKIEKHEPHLKPRLNSCVPNG